MRALPNQGYGHWRSHGEVHHRPPRQLTLPALPRRLHSAANAATGCRADARALPAAGDAADDGPNHRARSYLLRSILRATTALAPVWVRLDAVQLATNRDRVQLQNH